MELVVEYNNDSDLAVLETMLNRMQFRYTKTEKKENQKPDLSNSKVRAEVLRELRYLASKIKTSSFGDPVEWQRETRIDKPLAFRETE